MTPAFAHATSVILLLQALVSVVVINLPAVVLCGDRLRMSTPTLESRHHLLCLRHLALANPVEAKELVQALHLAAAAVLDHKWCARCVAFFLLNYLAQCWMVVVYFTKIPTLAAAAISAIHKLLLSL
jgi:hypothetical protein